MLPPSESAKKYVEYFGDVDEILRNAYLSGAKELREGINDDPANRPTGSADIQKAMTPEMTFDYMGIHLDANAAQDLNLKINVNFTNYDPCVLTVKSGVLLYQIGSTADDADLTIALPKEAVLALTAPDNETRDKAIEIISGDESILDKLNEHMLQFDPMFNIVEP